MVKKAQSDKELTALKDQAMELRERAKGLMGIERVTKNTQADFIENTLMPQKQQETKTKLAEQTRKITDEQTAAISDITQRTVDKSQLSFSKKYKNVFNGFAVNISESDLDAIKQSPYVKAVYPNTEVQALLTQSVPRTGAPDVWKMIDSSGQNVTGKGVTVAIIDTGIDYTHPDLGGCFGPSCKVVGGYDFENDDSDPMDDNGHGTHCAGIATANGAVKGVAPDAKLYAYKVLDKWGSGSFDNIIAAIDAAMDPNGDGDYSDHADVISMSLGGSGSPDDAMCQAVKLAVGAGVTIVVAAGNDGPGMGTVASPGVSPDAITVGAAYKNGTLAQFSSRGAPNYQFKPELSAPGVYIYSTVPKGSCAHCSSSGYTTLSGTSMATPHVAGAVALLSQLHPDWTPSQMKSALVTGSRNMSDSIWWAGAGELYVPDSAKTDVFLPIPIISYGFSKSGGKSVSVYSPQPLTLAAGSTDWHSLYTDGWSGIPSHISTNRSRLNQSSLTLQPSSISQISLSVVEARPTDPEGYHDGAITLTDGTRKIRIPFGYIDTASITTHVIDLDGSDMGTICPGGRSSGTLVYDVPQANFSAIASGCYSNVTFLVPGGKNYSIHAFDYMWPRYRANGIILSALVSVERSEHKDVYLRKSEAHEVTLNLTNPEGQTIFPRQVWGYIRYKGQAYNISWTFEGIDSYTEDYLRSKKSWPIYISETNATVGVALNGLSYSPGLLDFLVSNLDHWHELPMDYETKYPSVLGHFAAQTTSDLHYLLSWEFFGGVNSSMPSVLQLNESRASVYDIAYNKPWAMIQDPIPPPPYGSDWEHYGMSERSNWWVRRDTQIPVDFATFAPKTAKLYVDGIFEEMYAPQNMYWGLFRPYFYVPNYSQLLRTSGRTQPEPNIFVPNMLYMTPAPTTKASVTYGTAPFYPSVYMLNTNNTLAWASPLLMDKGNAGLVDAKPYFNIYRDGALFASDEVIEYFARMPTLLRKYDLTMGGNYKVVIDNSPSPRICNVTTTTLSFRVPSNDVNPPRITAFSMPQRFVPGEQINISLTAIDDQSPVTVNISWRPGGTTLWRNLQVSSAGSSFSASIPTAVSDSVIDLKLLLTDSSGNYLEYAASNAAFKQVPVLFDISVSPAQVDYIDGTVSVMLTGYLMNLSGNPLHPSKAILLELKAGERKLGAILDEYIDGIYHSHNGSIRFEWHFNPVKLFKEPGKTLQINVLFDFGIYQPFNKTFTLRAVNNTPLCLDGTLYGQCSTTSPKYCDNGALINKCTTCGCVYARCNTSSEACYANRAPNKPSPLIEVIGGSATQKTLRCSAIITDPDNDQMNVTFTWYRNGNWYGQNSTVGQASGSTPSAVRSSIALPETWSCMMELYDGSARVSGMSNNLTLTPGPGPNCSDGTQSGQCSLTKPKYCDNGNLIDKCTVCNCSSGLVCNPTTNACYVPNNVPATPQPFLVSALGGNTTQENLTCAGKVADADGDKMNATVRWYKNSALYLTNYFNNLTSNEFFNAMLTAGNLSVGQEWQCKAMATDGKSNGTWGDSNTLRIVNPPGVNSPPNTPQPSLVSSGGTNTVAEDLYCYDTIADLDQNKMNVTVNWYKNDALSLSRQYNTNYPTLTNFNTTLLAPNLTLGDVWKCSLRMYDGKDYSEWGNSSSLTIVAPPAPPQPPSGGGGGGGSGGGGGGAPPSGGGTIVAQPKPACVNSLEVTVPDQIFVPQRVTKQISVLVKNTGTCPLSSVSAVLSLSAGIQATSFILNDGLDVNESRIIGLTLLPTDIEPGQYSAMLKLDAPNATMSKRSTVWLLENPPYVVSQEGPSASRIFEYIIALILIEFVFGSIVMIVWFKPPQERLPPLPQIGSDLKPVQKSEVFRFR
jgi:subtilisin family serine protease